MTTPTPKQSLPRVLGEFVFLIAMSIGIVLGVPKGLALLVPAGFCAAAPVSETAFFMGIVFGILIALPKKKSGLRPLLRFGAAMLAGNILAHLAARLVVGCTPVAGWDEHAHFAVATFVVLVIFTPLAYLHHEIIEPRWSRAMGEGGEGAGEEGEE
ncbi:MAG: hypothetical protein IMF08_13095 [Proteobacteria bacterium]|nr:hypothetical protein [Pseudomonadota bacterium]